MKILPYTPGMGITPPCLVLGMPNDVYHSWPDSISNSGLTRIAQSPGHYMYRGPGKDSRFKDIGSAIHTALLEPEVFQSKYVLLRDVADRRASEYKAAAKVHGGEYVLTGPESDNVVGMVESVYSQPKTAAWLRSDGYREASLFVNDPVTGVLVRVRYDLLTKSGHVIDIKKTQDARPEAFSRSVFNYRYYVQAALYLDAWKWATGQDLKSFRFLAIEEHPPHATKLYKSDFTMLEEGRKEYRAALDSYAACVASGDWHLYEQDDDELISLPDWKLRQIEFDNEVSMED